MRESPQQTGLTACGAPVAGRYGVIAAGRAAQLPAAGWFVTLVGYWSRYAAQLARQLPTMTNASRS